MGLGLLVVLVGLVLLVLALLAWWFLRKRRAQVAAAEGVARVIHA